jgi:lysozyme
MPDSSPPRPPASPASGARIGINRRQTVRGLTAIALLVGVGAAVPAMASAAPAAGSPTPSSAVLPGPADGLVVHDRMVPATSPDAAHHDGTTGRSQDAATGPVQYGPDVSSWQHPGGAAINWGAVAGSGQAFAIVKATESGYVNPYLGTDIAQAHAAGLVVGAYAYARPQYDAAGQADKFSQAIGTLPAPALPPILDLEEAGGLNPADLIAWTHRFLDRARGATGITPMIYTGPWFWSTAMADNTGFAAYPLWEASYTTASVPQHLASWSTYTLWQFTDNAYIPGIGGGVDQSRFNGTADQLAASPGAIGVHYAELGGAAGFLGAPLGGEQTAPDGVGRFTHYQNGSIYWTPATGAHEVHGSIRAEWAATGWETGPTGYPVTDELPTPDGVGRFNHFSKGASIYWTPATGAHEVHGSIRAEWAATGWETGPTGYPVTDEYDVPSGRASDFQHGRISWSASTGAIVVTQF